MEKEIIPIILLTYKDSGLVAQLLSTIDEDYIDARIVVVDNGSTEETWNDLNKIDDPRVILTRVADNLGYTGGINYGVRFAIDNLPDFKSFFIINPDAHCTPNLVYNLSRILNSNEQAGCVSPKVLSIDRKVITYSGGVINLKKGEVKHIVFTDDKYPNESYELDSYTGCAVLFDVKKFVISGMLNDELFIYYDEADSSIKLKENNFKILYAPALEVYHDTSFTMRKVSHLKVYYMTRNKFIVFGKQMNLFSKLYFIGFQTAYHLKNLRFKCTVYHLKGVYDYLAGKKGRYSS